jgi:hypothetical protein
VLPPSALGPERPLGAFFIPPEARHEQRTEPLRAVYMDTAYFNFTKCKTKIDHTATVRGLNQLCVS